jgi:transcriptional regulator with XRE-family HTH domain
MTLTELSRLTGLSGAMLSKIENGQASASLSTLKTLARAFNVPINLFFRTFEERRDASYVPAGEGVQLSRRHQASGHDYQLIGHSANARVSFEPYLVQLTEDGEVFPRKQESGVWFIHMLAGRLVYRFGDNLYAMSSGDSLTYDADAPHGIERVEEFPATYLCAHADRRDA